MGASTSEESVPVTMEGLIEEGRATMRSAMQIMSSTMDQELRYFQNYQEMAASKAASTLEAIKKKSFELSDYGENAQRCVQKSETDLQGVESKMKKTLAECYSKHYGAVDEFRAKRAKIYEEAMAIKNEAQRLFSNCMSSTERMRCFQLGLTDLKLKLVSIYKKLDTLTKKEAAARVKASKLVYECDKKAMAEAYKKSTKIIEDMKKCIGNIH